MRSAHTSARDIIGITAMTVAAISVLSVIINTVNGQPFAALMAELLLFLVAVVVCVFAVLADNREEFSRRRRF